MQPPGALQMSVSATADCRWNAVTAVPWITVTNQTGTGNGAPRLLVSENWDAPREGVVAISGLNGGQTLNVRVAQAGCVYWASSEEMTFNAGGGAGSFDVMQESLPNTCGGPKQNACVWSAVADVPWILITSPMPRAGDNPVAFAVAANNGPERHGVITVRDRTVRITQTGR